MGYEISLKGIRRPVQIRFHPDDIQEAFGVLATFAPDSIEGPEDYQKAEDAFARALVALDTAISRREVDEFNAEADRQHRYFVGR